jgi:F-type H+-transporting ATPase subunit b
MPQIDQILEIYASQLFWLVVVFGLIYVFIGKGMLPKIEATVESRDKRIAEDLAAAHRARSAAEETEANYRARIDAARAEAQQQTQAAKAAAALDAEKRVKAADAELATKAAEADARLSAARQAALAEIDQVATDAAQEIVARVAGIKVDQTTASQAVKTALADA